MDTEGSFVRKMIVSTSHCAPGELIHLLCEDEWLLSSERNVSIYSDCDDLCERILIFFRYNCFQISSIYMNIHVYIIYESSFLGYNRFQISSTVEHVYIYTYKLSGLDSNPFRRTSEHNHSYIIA